MQIADRKNAVEFLAGCLWGLAVRAGLWLGVGALCLVGALIGALSGGALYQDTGGAALGALVGGAACASLGVMGIMAWTLAWLSARGWRADAAFASVGLPARAYFLTGRQAHGSVGGRQVDAYFTSQGLSLQLELYIAAQVQTRLSLTMKSAISQAATKAFKPDALELTNMPGLDHMAAAPLDMDWARSLLRDSAAQSALARLCAAPGARETRSIFLQPGAFHLLVTGIPDASLTADNFREWVADLSALAARAEGLSPPSNPTAAYPLEERVRSQRGQGYMKAALIVTAAIIGFSILCSIPVIALIVLAASAQ